MLIGYARVSKSGTQDTASQIRALKEAGCTRLFEEAASGGRWERPELRKTLDQLRSGDRLVVADLVRREAGRDGRTLGLVATRVGRRSFEAIRDTRLERLGVALKKLTQEEKSQLGAISAKLLGGSASSSIQAKRICRLCDHSVCFGRGSCPVAEAVDAVQREKL